MLRSIVTAALAALTLAGCGSEMINTPEASLPAVSADEQQIRDLVHTQTRAFTEGNWPVLADLTCAQFRDKAGDPASYLVPPMTAFGTREQMASLTIAQVSEGLTRQFGTGAPRDTLDRVSQALVAYDEPAYEAGMLDLIRQSATLTVDKVENITVTGDTATADVTTTRRLGQAAPDTRTDTTPFVREDGRWLDCTDLSGAS
ncbi:hypothetical protein CRI77_20080 [Mycolicibacterium duvalii]|uniref:Uncharacterized protein n=1 Tax=Mycolicibacterium duvalii TaxID=39688 RepID=A0A7I7JW22_9MYCO|nr:hypothetical protein [Mycolicibacterium duvalii]MCV7369257.1 hypothetical protein [Mycolicibacterium duvalii]PEG37683.1 hypothetical protein CRI77_20080 [Mycolicibacterium duvalii]BBX15441.1 hypothetical protein MDUV_03010 [Mycolicibacterium duvalii]